MFRMHHILIIAVFIFGSLAGGCKSKDAEKPSVEQTDATTASTEPVEQEKAESPEKQDSTENLEEVLSPDELRKKNLKESYLRLHCLRKSSGAESSMLAYKDAGFDTAAAWSKAWHAEAEKNPEWATTIVSEAIEKGCKYAQQNED